MADLRISELAALAGADLVAGDLLAVADVSASETKKITVTDFVGNAVTLIADATIPNAKILFSSATIPGSALQNTSVDTTQLADDSVTADKLGDQSTVDLVTTLPAGGAFVGQIALDTDIDTAYIWDGSQWISFKAAGSINSVVGSSSGIVNLSVSTVGDTATITTSLDDTTGAAEFLAGPTGAAGTVGYRPIVGTDLPTATTTTKGAVQVNGEGLRLTSDQIEIDNDITASATHHVVTYDDKGLITGGRAITAADLPAATDSAVGGVIVGTGLSVNLSGLVNHSNSVSSGTGTKVTFDSEGHITGTVALDADDIPDIPASKLTTGTLPTERIAADAVTGEKLADRSTSLFGDTQPTAEYIGQLYFNSLSRDIYIWDGNVWQPIGISVGEIVLAGTYDASTNLVDSVTSDGTAAGFSVGSALPAAAAVNNRYYLVVSEAGTGTSPAPTVSLSPPDFLLSNGSTWTAIDVSDTVTSQTASNVTFTPYGTISATNVQAAIEEVLDEGLTASGGTITGELLIGSAGSFAFEGSSDNAYETYLTVVDPTADRTITFPNVTGTVITTGDTGTVTSAMLAGSIADSKLSTISTANKVNLSAVDIDGGTDIGGALADADLFIVDDGGGGTNRKSAATRVADYTFSKISGDITIAAGGTASIGSGVIVDADVSNSAAITGTKIQQGSTSVRGTVQLTDGTASTSTTTAATPNAVKSAYDLASAALPKAGGTMTGEIVLDEIKETVYTLGTSGSIALDPANGSIQSSVLTGAPTFTDSLEAGQTIVLMLENGASYTVTWPTITWVTGAGNAAPTLTAKDTLVLWKVSTTLYGAYVGSYV